MHSWRAERSTSRAVANHARKQQQSMGSAASQIGLNYFSVHGTERHAWFVGEEHYIHETGDAAQQCMLLYTSAKKKKGGAGPVRTQKKVGSLVTLLMVYISNQNSIWNIIQTIIINSLDKRLATVGFRRRHRLPVVI